MLKIRQGLKKIRQVVLTLTALGFTCAVSLPSPDGDPQLNSPLTDEALLSHPFHHARLPNTPNAVAAAAAASRINHALLADHDDHHHHGHHHHHHHGPALPIPSLAPTLHTYVPPGVCEIQCSILDLLAFNPKLSTFVSMVKAARLLPLLSAAEDPMTVFVPTNYAFELLPPAKFEALLSDPTALKAILLRHMTRGAFASADLPTGTASVVTGAGETVLVTRYPTEISVTSLGGTSRLIEADNEASNGIVHVVDKVF